MGERKTTIGVVAIILLVVGSVWAFRSRSDPQVEKIKQMISENTPPEQRRGQWELIRKEMEQLSPEQHREIRQQMHESFAQRGDQRIDTYFALPPQQRIAYLDKQIDEEEKRRKEWESRRTQANRSSAPGGTGQQGGAAGNRPPRPPRDSSPDARLLRHDQRLDRRTAEQRAERDAYRADMRARRIQRGLPATPPHRHH